MRALSLLSGGKDSFMAAQIAQEQGYDIEASLTVIPEEFSMMFHYPNAAKAEQVASLLRVPWYTTSESKFKFAIEQFAGKGIQAVISGAIASEYQKTRIERLCTKLGIESYTPLWKKDQKDIMNEVLQRGIRAMIVSVSAEGFDDNDLGRIVNENYIEDLEARNLKYGFNISGEGGEYETFVLGASGTKQLEVTKSKKVWEGSHGYFIIEELSEMK